MMALQRNGLGNTKAGILLDLTLATGGWQLAFDVNSQLSFLRQEHSSVNAYRQL